MLSTQPRVAASRVVFLASRHAVRTFATSATEEAQSSSATTTKKMKNRIVVAVGGNALQRRGDRLTIENMLKASAEFAPTMAELARDNELGEWKGTGNRDDFAFLRFADERSLLDRLRRRLPVQS